MLLCFYLLHFEALCSKNFFVYHRWLREGSWISGIVNGFGNWTLDESETWRYADFYNASVVHGDTRMGKELDQVGILISQLIVISDDFFDAVVGLLCLAVLWVVVGLVEKKTHLEKRLLRMGYWKKEWKVWKVLVECFNHLWRFTGKEILDYVVGTCGLLMHLEVHHSFRNPHRMGDEERGSARSFFLFLAGRGILSFFLHKDLIADKIF